MSAIHALAAGTKNVIATTPFGRSNVTAHDLLTRLRRDYRPYSLVDASSLEANDIISEGVISETFSEVNGIVVTNLELATPEVLAIIAELFASRTIFGTKVLNLEAMVIVTVYPTNARILELAALPNVELTPAI